jgi:DNA-binding IclR family transcriptional regulator/sugar lactone lactonase YvrE
VEPDCASPGPPSSRPVIVAGAQSFARTIALLDLIADADAPPRFVDLLAASGLAKGTLHRMLSALAAQGLARQRDDATWHLGARLLSLAHRVWADFDLRAEAREEMRRLARLWGGSVHLAIPEQDEALIVDLVETSAGVRLPFGVGRRLPLHASALGKALLAFSPPSRRVGLLAGLKLASSAPNTLTSAGALELSLDLAVARGYALDDEELQAGIRCIAAPILNHTASPIGVISLSQAVFRADLDRLHAAARDVVDAARRIAGNSGARPAFSIETPPRPSAAPDPGLRVLPDINCLVGEFPFWHEGSLLLVDLLEPALWQAGPPTARVGLDEIVSCLFARRGGGLLAAGRAAIGTLDRDSGQFDPLVPIPAGPGHRINDGGCDRAGRLWLGTMAIDATPGQGALWRVAADGAYARVDDGLGVPNGIAWSPDERFLYLVDSRARTIWRYPHDAEGRLGAREALIRVAPADGNPAGLAVDEAGGIWTALWDGWRAVRFFPDGVLDHTIHLPVPRPANLGFAGAGSSTLIMTTARVRLSRAALQAAPLSGRVFTCQTLQRGMPAHSTAL